MDRTKWMHFCGRVLSRGGGGAGNANAGGGGRTKTYKQSTSGYRDSGPVSVTPGQSISVVVGSGGDSFDIEEGYGHDGTYSQFMSSSYRANGGDGGYYSFNNNSSSYRGVAGSGGSGGAGWNAPSGAGSDGGDGYGGPPVSGGSGQGHTTRDFGESSGKRNAGGGGNDRDAGTQGNTNGGASDYTQGSGSEAEGLYGTPNGGGGYGGGASGATNMYSYGPGGDGTVLIRYYSY